MPIYKWLEFAPFPDAIAKAYKEEADKDFDSMFDDMPAGKPFKESDSGKTKKPVDDKEPVDDIKEKQDFNTPPADTETPQNFMIKHSVLGKPRKAFATKFIEEMIPEDRWGL